MFKDASQALIVLANSIVEKKRYISFTVLYKIQYFLLQIRLL